MIKPKTSSFIFYVEVCKSIYMESLCLVIIKTNYMLLWLKSGAELLKRA